MKTASRSVTLKVTNSLDSSRILMIEPWTVEYSLPPGKTLEVLAEGDLSFPLGIEIAEDRIIVHGFDTTDSMLTVFDSGRELKSYPHGDPGT